MHKAKPSDEEIARRRAESAARKAAAPPKQAQQPKKKERDPAAESAALREFGVAPLIDIGANLQARGSFEQVAEAVGRAAVAGVEAVVLTGCDLEGSARGLECAARWQREVGPPQRIFATAGVHPHEASSWDAASAAEIRRLASCELCVSLGETGLDYDRMLAPRETQLAVFKEQASLAKELGMPLFVHCREVDPGNGPSLGAYRDAVRVLRETGIDPAKCCVHCFTGDADDLSLVLEFGAYVGLTGYVGIAKRAALTLEAIARASSNLDNDNNCALLDRLMCETDAPFMLPDKTWLPTATAKKLGVRGGKNEPALLPAVCRALAAALSSGPGDAVDPETVARVTTANARAFFNLPPHDLVDDQAS